ncbi:hypothetical protein QPK87_04040 [Kamptonema cortianum]|nr:hypothetical protein [Kamptonema cortianum]MDL5048049.1 hypothetical protein [Oscillatoria amoena NRMC-F 0135]
MKCLFLVSSLIVLIGLTGCGQIASRRNPPVPQEEIKIHIAESLPGYVTIDGIDLDVKSDREDEYRASFKLTMKAAENLFIQVKDADLNLDILDIAQKEGEAFNLYGTIRYARRVDKWFFGDPHFDAKWNFLGKPRSSFSANIIVKDSEAYHRLKSEAEAKIQAKKLAEEKKEAERQAVIQSLRTLFKEGSVMKGTLTHKDHMFELMKKYYESQPIELRVVSVKGDAFVVEMFHPDNKDSRQIYEGKIGDQILQTDKERIVLYLQPKDIKPSDDAEIWKFYTLDGHIALYPDGHGVSGQALFTDRFRYDLKFRGE